MYKKLTMFMAIIAVICFMVNPAFAKGKSGQAGSSNIGHLYLVPHPEAPEGYEDGYGKIKYNLTGCTLDFVFNGHGLPAVSVDDQNENEEVIYYGLYSKKNLLGFSKAVGAGNVHIQGSVGCKGKILDNGRFNLWTVTFKMTGEEVKVKKGDRILWTGQDMFNGFQCTSCE
jgi:hypothetical protein